MASSMLCFLLLIATTASSLSPVKSADSVFIVPRGGPSSGFSTHQYASFWQTADFTLGFQRMDDVDQLYLLCIWRSADLHQTALWWPAPTDFTHMVVLQSTQGAAENSTSDSAGPLAINSPTVPNGTIFNFTSNGNLQLIYEDGCAGHLVLWSVGNNASLVELSNTGNLLLRNESQAIVWQSFGDRRDTMIMPARPDISIDVDLVVSNSRLLQSRSSWNRTSSSYAAGRFHAVTGASTDLYLHALEQHYGVDFMYTDGNIQVYADGHFSVWKKRHKYESNSSTGMSLVRLDPDSNLRVYLWSETKRTWQQEWQLLLHRCFLGGPCGPFGICRDPELDGIASIKYTCDCPPGYSPLDPLDASKGCGSDLNFTAIGSSASYHNYSATAYSMAKVPNSDYDYGNMYSYIVVQDMVDCLSLCLNDSKCSAAYFVASDSHCWLKGDQPGGILMNGYTLSPDSGNMLSMKLLKGSQSIRSTPEGGSSNSSKGGIVGGILAGIVSVIMVATTAIMCAARWMKFGAAGAELLLARNGGIEEGITVVRFTHQELVEATDHFKHLLGEGGFGKVYKGWLKHKAPAVTSTGTPISRTNPTCSSNGGLGPYRATVGTTATTVHVDAVVAKAVAVKVLKGPPKPVDDDARNKEYMAAKQFKAEVSTLGKIHHVNLVNLIGYCEEDADGRQMRALVFEFMEHGSLDGYLTGSSKMTRTTNSTSSNANGEEEVQRQKLAWERRYSIAVGMARGIAYLHHECNPPILHSDIKPQNVLLDGQFTAKVADFGLARRFQETKTHLTVSVVHGTRGYMAPDWLKTDAITSKVDVYSFGVVLLELVRGLCDCHRYRQLRLPGAHNNNYDSTSIDLEVALPIVDWAFRYLQTNCNYRGAPSTSTESKNETERSEATGEVPEQVIAMEREHMQLQQKIRLVKVGLWCVQPAAEMRPSMQRVVQLMEATGSGGGEIEAPPFPPTPPQEWSSDSDKNISFNIPAGSHYIEVQTALSGR